MFLAEREAIAWLVFSIERHAYGRIGVIVVGDDQTIELVISDEDAPCLFLREGKWRCRSDQ